MIERAAAAVLAVFLAAGTVYAEDVPERPEVHVGDLERPEVHIGDRWTYRQVDGFTSEVTADFSRRVVAVSDTEIIALQEVKGTTNRKPMYFDRNWNLIDDGNAEYTPSLDLVDFPLHQGDTWKHQYQGTILKSGRSVVCTVTGKALDTESTAVPAGTFDAVKLETSTECRGTDADSTVTEFSNVTWYSPQVRRPIRLETSTSSDGRVRSKTVIELLEYHLTE